ncbi:hypothetical protein C8R46DRAFT_1201331 [Mycena filopes]|nr:hypothetical protein C8R46DRAFT_1201331 [Mycena filopes]
MLPPSLQLEPALLELSLPLRSLATTAAAGSLHDLTRLLAAGSATTCPEEERQLLLPVFYASLDSSGIPTIGQLDEPDYLSLTHIGSALASFSFLSILKSISPDAALLIWRRFHPWMEFFHDYGQCLGLGLDELQHHIMCIVVLIKLKADKGSAVRAEILETPGMRTVYTRTWSHILSTTEDCVPDDVLNEVYAFLSVEGCKSEHFDEYLAGVGGNVVDLASLFVRHIARYMTWPAPGGVALQLSCFSIPIFFVINNHDNLAFQEALHAQGFVRSLVQVAESIAVRTAYLDFPTRSLAGSVLVSIWGYLNVLFSGPRAHRLIREAIRAGLLRSLMSAAVANNGAIKFLHRILGKLMRHLVYYSVLSCLPQALRDVRHLQCATAFSHCELFDTRSEFWVLAQERLDIMAEYESPDFVSSKACDNVKCGSIHRKRDLMRCSSCNSQYYCSPRCQKTDWHDGHRNTCHTRASLYDEFPGHLGTRDQSFLRALVHHHYLEQRHSILTMQLSYRAADPTEAMCVVFDFAQPDGIVRILHMRAELLEARWPDELARAARSGGRIELHVALVLSPDLSGVRMVPMQLSSSALADGLEKIERDVEAGVGGSAPVHEQIPGRIEALMNLTAQELVYVH